MTIIYGYSEAQERMANETDKPAPRVALDKDFYTNNHVAVKRKNKEVSDAKEEGLKSDVFRKNNYKKNNGVDNEYAIGGVVKERRGFYD